MNVLSLNIRGMSKSHKFDWLHKLRKEHKFSFCGLQETHLSYDLAMGGRKFTYFSDVGCKPIKLDRFHVFPNFLAAFPCASAFALPRDYSDHSPILLRTSYLNFGLSPSDFLILGFSGMVLMVMLIGY